MRRLWRRVSAVALGTAMATALVGTTTSNAREGADVTGGRVVIRYTEYGVPHILARTLEDAGYGFGHAVTRDNLCLLADAYTTVAAQRSFHHGPDGTTDTTLSSARANLASDLHFQAVIDSGVVERLIAAPAPLGPRPEVRALVRGYVEGFNRYLRDTPRIGDPTCAGAGWVRPITELDVYRLLYALTTVSGIGALAEGIVEARPVAAAAPVDAGRLVERVADLVRPDGMGSNAIALGAGGVARGTSLLLGNPHFPWRGANRFWQVQLTVPGVLNVSGAALLGTPFVQKGYNDRVAWSHTLATARTFGLYELETVPGDPTAYVVDGVPERMTAHVVRVRARQADGSLAEVSRTLYNTRYGPVLTSAAGVPLPWTSSSAYAVRDANATNLRGLNTWYGLATASSAQGVVDALSSTQGAPWVNTLAVDRDGAAVYANVQVVPHVTDELAARCGTPLGGVLFPAGGISVLDGSASACAWGSDPGAVEPGLFAPGRMAVLRRDDYVLNSNDSPWLVNASAPITGLPRIIGDTGAPRSPRTREAFASVLEGLAAGGFTRESLQDLLFADRSRTAVLAADATAAMCASFPDGLAPMSAGTVPVGSACAALRGWDHRYSVDSRGSLLFERFALRLAGVEGGPWVVPFDPAAPLTTPHTLAVSRPEVQRAFGDAVAELVAAGVPLDGRLGDEQQVVLAEQRIPLPGAPDALGVLNLVNPAWDPASGVSGIRTGSSYLQVVAFDRQGCPDAATLVAYSQSADPTSPHHADQTWLFSAGRWARGRHCEQDILSSPALRVVVLR
ncbi:MAG: penicillin acylase family protein [Saccharothrix sp.]|nr:penicillin acylase family protein [Saccharothrix sp.]